MIRLPWRRHPVLIVRACLGLRFIACGAAKFFSLSTLSIGFQGFTTASGSWIGALIMSTHVLECHARGLFNVGCEMNDSVASRRGCQAKNNMRTALKPPLFEIPDRGEEENRSTCKP